jgi:hypothetical protein
LFSFGSFGSALVSLAGRPERNSSPNYHHRQHLHRHVFAFTSSACGSKGKATVRESNLTAGISKPTHLGNQPESPK